MIKLSIKDFEQKILKSIKRNKKIIAFDTAKTCGIAFIRTTNINIIVDWCKLEFNYNSQEEMLKLMHTEFGNILSDEDLAIIEEVFVGFSRTGSLHLAKMGTLAIAQCINKKIDFKLISALSARSKFFKLDSKKYKGRTKEAVGDYLKTIGIVTEDNDVNDAIILGLCGICDGIDFRSKKEISKIQKKMKKKKGKKK